MRVFFEFYNDDRKQVTIFDRDIITYKTKEKRNTIYTEGIFFDYYG